MVNDRMGRFIVGLVVAFFSFVALASTPDKEATMPGGAGAQELTAVKTFWLRPYQWRHFQGAGFKVCPGRFRRVGGDLRCRIPDNGFNGFMGGMVTGTALTVQDAIEKMAGPEAKVVEVVLEGNPERLLIKYTYPLSVNPESLTDFDSIGTATPTQKELEEVQILTWGFYIALGIGVIFVCYNILLAYKSPSTLSEYDRSRYLDRLREEARSQRPVATVVEPPPLVQQPIARQPPIAAELPQSEAAGAPAGGRRLFLD